MMGFLKCPECNNIVMPNCSERKVKIEERTVEGTDPGWT
jgi:hypothetical protein